MTRVTRVLDGRKIDLMSLPELRSELRSMIVEAARLERAATCFHENVRSVEYTGTHDDDVRMYTCRDCNFSWRD
jgi:hypothetical protein